MIGQLETKQKCYKKCGTTKSECYSKCCDNNYQDNDMPFNININIDSNNNSPYDNQSSQDTTSTPSYQNNPTNYHQNNPFTNVESFATGQPQGESYYNTKYIDENGQIKENSGEEIYQKYNSPSYMPETYKDNTTNIVKTKQAKTIRKGCFFMEFL